MNISLNLNQKESKKISNANELVEYILECGNETKKMSEEERAEMDARIMAKIMAKLQAGRKLTQEELDYLQRTNPIMYAHAMRVQRMTEAVEEQLKHAKSKEEANHIISSAMTGVSKNDPDREYIYAAISRVTKEFKDSDAYAELPDTAEEEYEGFNLLSWSPLTEVYDDLPTFSANA